MFDSVEEIVGREVAENRELVTPVVFPKDVDCLDWRNFGWGRG